MNIAHSIVRTLGDGMDNSLLVTENDLKRFNLNLKIDDTNKILQSLKPREPKSKMYELVPVYVPKKRKYPKYLTKKLKEPRFIPYEPYKAAVEPIIPNKLPCKPTAKNETSKNNVEIQQLVEQMSEMREAEVNKEKVKSIENEEPLIPVKQWQKEKTAYETDIKNLRETNSHLENQLKLQLQVNSELKTLLVAAVGEDLETRVAHLTEDKLQLARALLNSANHLTSHQEQTEWLSGQCEVWRSKFLASSLMVEELARWKSALTSRISDLQETLKSLLEERKIVQKICVDVNTCLKNLISTGSNENVDELFKLKSANIVDLGATNLKLVEYALKYFSCKIMYTSGIQQNLELFTPSEKNALKLLKNPVIITNKQEAICNALVGAAVSCGQQIYLKTSSSHAACCSHCQGEMKNI